MPYFKRSGKDIFGVTLNSKEQAALEKECLRQEAEYTRKYEVEIEALVLRQLHHRHGFGEKRLREFYDTFADDLMEMVEKYELGESDQAWLATKQLKDKGFDIEKWHKEKYGD